MFVVLQSTINDHGWGAGSDEDSGNISRLLCPQIKQRLQTWYLN